jgi:hypothetical protein
MREEEFDMTSRWAGSVVRWAWLVLGAALWLAFPACARAQNGDASSCYYLDFNGHRIGPYPASNLPNAIAVMTGYGYTFTGWYNHCTNECGGDGCGASSNNGNGCYYLNFNGQKYGPFATNALGYVYTNMTAQGFTMTGWLNVCTNQCAGDACTPQITSGGACYYLSFNGQRIGPYAESSLPAVYKQMTSYGYTMTGWVNTCNGQCGGDGCQ